MTEERVRELESVGFEWGTSKTGLASSWSVRFQQMCEFKEQFGHCVVPHQYTANPELGKWVSTQRSHYKLYQEGKPRPHMVLSNDSSRQGSQVPSELRMVEKFGRVGFAVATRPKPLLFWILSSLLSDRTQGEVLTRISERTETEPEGWWCTNLHKYCIYTRVETFGHVPMRVSEQGTS